MHFRKTIELPYAKETFRKEILYGNTNFKKLKDLGVEPFNVRFIADEKDQAEIKSYKNLPPHISFQYIQTNFIKLKKPPAKLSLYFDFNEDFTNLTFKKKTWENKQLNVSLERGKCSAIIKLLFWAYVNQDNPWLSNQSIFEKVGLAKGDKVSNILKVIKPNKKLKLVVDKDSKNNYRLCLPLKEKL